MRTRAQIESIEIWLERLPGDHPLVANRSSQHTDELSKQLETIPILLETDLEALLWLRLGLIDRAHAIVQNAATGLSAYIHGMVHRLDQDYWNSKYWFRQVGRNKPEELLRQIADRTGTSIFDPSAFTNQVESWSQNKDPILGKKLAELAFAEWQAVWDWAKASW